MKWPIFGVIAVLSAWAMITSHSTDFTLMLGALLLLAFLSGAAPGGVLKVINSRTAPMLVTLVGGWFLFLSPASTNVKVHVDVILLPVLALLALFGGLSRS